MYNTDKLIEDHYKKEIRESNIRKTYKKSNTIKDTYDKLNKFSDKFNEYQKFISKCENDFTKKNKNKQISDVSTNASTKDERHQGEHESVKNKKSIYKSSSKGSVDKSINKSKFNESRNYDKENNYLNQRTTPKYRPQTQQSYLVQQNDNDSDSSSVSDSSEEERACNTNSVVMSLDQKRSFLKFRQIYVFERPPRRMSYYSKYYFKLFQENSLVRFTLEDNGFRESNNDRYEPSILWSNSSINTGVYSKLNRFQLVNHFPHSFELTRKDNLYRNIMVLQKQFGRDGFNFIPQSFILPQDSGILASEMMKDSSKWYIVKPHNQSQGKGIFITNKWSEIKSKNTCVVSEYISNPLLVDDYKFDIRLYVIVTSWHPLTVYLYDDGLVRYASEQYIHPSISGSHNMYIHLTNYSINKNNENFTENVDAEEDAIGNKWSYSAFISFLEDNNIDSQVLSKNIEALIIKSLIAAEPKVVSACNNHLNFRHNCFEIYGYDVMLDDTLKPHLIEINLSPSLACGSPLDLKIKGCLLKDTLNLVGIISNETRDYQCKFDKYVKTHSNQNNLAYTRTVKNLQPAYKSTLEQTEAWKNMAEICREYYNVDISHLSREDRYHLKHFEEELSRANNMKCIFPGPDYKKFKKYFREERKVNELLAMRFSE